MQIFPAFAATLWDNPSITHAFVFADLELYSNSAREAVNQILALAASLKIPAPLVYVSHTADAPARDAILMIKKEHP